MSQKSKKNELEVLQQEVADLTADLQRIQADFVNYRRRVDEERRQVIDTAKGATIMKLLPVIDDIERALGHMPADLADNAWAKGVASLPKNLEKSLQDLGVERIKALHQVFDPQLHEAVSAEDGDGDTEVVVQELRAGYKSGDQVIRPSLVKVGHRSATEAEPKS